MKAEIFAIGTELLMGELSDTNGSWIASKLPPLGIQVDRITGIGDDLEALTEAFSNGIGNIDFIFTTGGLGPTQDDLTREAIALALGETANVQQEVVVKLQNYFESRGTPMPQANILIIRMELPQDGGRKKMGPILYVCQDHPLK